MVGALVTVWSACGVIVRNVVGALVTLWNAFVHYNLFTWWVFVYMQQQSLYYMLFCNCSVIVLCVCLKDIPDPFGKYLSGCSK